MATQLAIDFLALAAVAATSSAPPDEEPAPEPAPEPLEPGRFRLVAYYDLRPIDWDTGKRVPLSPGEGHECDRCGRDHARCYEVADETTGRRWILGERCMGKALDGWNPGKPILAAARKAEREAARAAASDRMRAHAEGFAAALLLRRGEIPAATSDFRDEAVPFEDRTRRVQYVAGQRINPDHVRSVGFEERDAWMLRRQCYEGIAREIEKARRDAGGEYSSKRREMIELALTVTREIEERDHRVAYWIDRVVRCVKNPAGL
jgi:hypothetical protein